MKKWFLWGIFGIALASLVWWRFSQRSAASGPTPGPSAPKAGGQGGGAKTIPVAVATATPHRIREVVQAVASVESPFKIEISPKIGGRIDFLESREGDVVRPGQVLVRINPGDLQASVYQQIANVAEAKSKLAQAEITQSATDVGISGQVRQQSAALVSARADLDQLVRNFDAQVAAAQAQAQSATNNLRSAETAVEREAATLQNVQSKYDRTKNLYGQGFLAAQDLDDAANAVSVQKSTLAVARDQVSSAKSLLEVQRQNLTIVRRKGQADIAAGRARLSQAKVGSEIAAANRAQSPAYRQSLIALRSQVDAAVAQLSQAQARLRDTVVTSTIAGTVTARKADPGAMATAGQAILEVQFLDWVYVNASVPIDSGAAVHEGQTAKITIDGLPNETFSGLVANLNPAADPTNRQFSLKVRLNNSDHRIRPGAYARISITTGEVDAKVTVPREALVQSKQDNTYSVTVVSSDNKADVRPVTVGVQNDQNAEILTGVAAGEQVVVLTYNTLKSGQKVTTDLQKPGSEGKKKRKGKSGAKPD